MERRALENNIRRFDALVIQRRRELLALTLLHFHMITYSTLLVLFQSHALLCQCSGNALISHYLLTHRVRKFFFPYHLLTNTATSATLKFHQV
jgi:uncharacterized membrane protein (DUF485 family)